MDETEVAVKVEVHDHDIESLKYRVNDLESQSKAIQELAISVNRMAVIQNCDGSVRELGSRLKTWLEENMELLPGDSDMEPELSQGTQFRTGLW